MKKLICIILCLVMILSIFTIVPFEVGAEEIEKSSVGMKSGDYKYEVLEDGTVEITGYTNTSKTSLEIPERIDGKLVTSIGSGAFYDCSSLTSVTIPNSVKSIGNSAFLYCESLTSITIPNSVTSIDKYAFEYCTSLKSVTIGNSVTSIGVYAFKSCISLMNITIPNSVTSIGEGAFYGCPSLTSITIPNSVTSIGDETFEYCRNLMSITIPNSVTSIGYMAFSDCTSLTSITIPNSVTNIGYDAFCRTAWYDNQPDGLVYAGKVAYTYKGKMPENTSIILKEGTIGIAGGAFRYCENLTSVIIPNSVTSIGKGAFEDCTSLTSITIPNSVTSIGHWAFSSCSSLASVTIPNSVTSIGIYAFEYCTSLTSITIPYNVTSIGDMAFQCCTSLTSITIPDSVTSIGAMAFGYYYNSYEYKKFDNFTIYGTKGTEAERYANGNGFVFIPNQEKVFEAPENDVQKFTDLRNLKLKANLHYAEVDPEIEIPFSYDFFSSDNVITQAQTYNNNLATLGLVLATEAGFKDDRLRECFCVNGNDDSKLIVDAYRAYNFTKYSKFWNFDTDNPACAFAYKKQLIDGKEQNVFFIIVRGSTDIGDWITDVKILSDGFQKSANNVKELFKSFVEYNTDVSLANLSKSNNKFFVVGHSLGAAVVDDLSPLLYDYAQQKDIYTYAFATPKTVKNKSIDRVSHIHNILNASDVVTDVGVSVSGTRHGQEVRFSSYNSNIKEYFDKMHDYSFDSKVYEICKSLNVKDSVGLYHSSDAYLSYLLTRNDKKSGFIAYPYKKAAVRCPVDVEIYNSKNELVGKIVNNEVQEIENQEVIIQIDDDEKYIFMPFEDDYLFKLTGNDSGTMDISFEGSDENGNEINKQFTNVPLEKGKEFSSDLNDKEIDKTKLIESESDKEYLTGDADGNGNVDIIDCTVIQKRLANLSNQSFFENLADADHDKRITIIDATTIQKYLAHIISYI